MWEFDIRKKGFESKPGDVFERSCKIRKSVHERKNGDRSSLYLNAEELNGKKYLFKLPRKAHIHAAAPLPHRSPTLPSPLLVPHGAPNLSHRFSRYPPIIALLNRPLPVPPF